MASTKEVLDHHLECCGEGDLKGILSDYAHGCHCWLVQQCQLAAG